MVANAGTVKNTGIELALNWRDEVGSDFSYGIGLNLAHNKNEVTEVNNGTHYVNGGNALLSGGNHLYGLYGRRTSYRLLLGL